MSVQFDLNLAHTIGISDFAMVLLPIFIVDYPKQSQREFKGRRKNSPEKRRLAVGGVSHPTFGRM
jgi:hypothetical protein